MRSALLAELVKAYAPASVLAQLDTINALEIKVAENRAMVRTLQQDNRTLHVEIEGRYSQIWSEAGKMRYERQEAKRQPEPEREPLMVRPIVPSEVHLIHKESRMIQVMDADRDASEIKAMLSDGWRHLSAADYVK